MVTSMTVKMRVRAGAGSGTLEGRSKCEELTVACKSFRAVRVFAVARRGEVRRSVLTLRPTIPCLVTNISSRI